MQALSGIRTGILCHTTTMFFCQLDAISDLWIIEHKDASDMPDDTSHAANKHEKGAGRNNAGRAYSIE